MSRPKEPDQKRPWEEDLLLAMSNPGNPERELRVLEQADRRAFAAAKQNLIKVDILLNSNDIRLSRIYRYTLSPKLIVIRKPRPYADYLINAWRWRRGLSDEERGRIKKIAQSREIPLRDIYAVEYFEGVWTIITAKGNIKSRDGLKTFEFSTEDQVSRTPGRNETGHWLPASPTTRR